MHNELGKCAKFPFKISDAGRHGKYARTCQGFSVMEENIEDERWLPDWI